MPLPTLPPAFQLVALDREVGAFERAARAAPRGVDDGTVYWTERHDRLEMAVVLEPEAPARTTLQAAHVLMVAVGDALGALVPPGKPVAFAWPTTLLLDGALLGRVRDAAGRHGCRAHGQAIRGLPPCEGAWWEPCGVGCPENADP